MNSYHQREYARQLLASPRGQHLIGQALYHAMRAMSRVKLPFRETSDIEDMAILTLLFPFALASLDKAQIVEIERLRQRATALLTTAITEATPPSKRESKQ